MARKTTPAPYAPPLDQLLTLGCPGCKPGDSEPWRLEPFADYAAMGITPEHLPELRRMAFDRSLADDDLGYFGPVHAARALGVLHPPELVPQLIPDFIELTRRLDEHDDDFWLDDMPAILARFGEDAIDPVARAARDSRASFGTRLFLLAALERIATEHPRTHGRVIALFIDLLKYARHTDPAINACIISSLVELNAEEALPAIRNAFANDHVDRQSCGRLKDIEEDITLTPEQRKARRKARFDQSEKELCADLDGLSDQEAQIVINQRLIQRMSDRL